VNKGTNKGIDFITASNGGIECHGYYHNIGRAMLAWADNVNDLSRIINKYGLRSVVYGSSSIDFCSEEGFSNDDGANKLWKDALERAGV
tara:strand:+ start:76 stop:342 length:267 start_codon:yes stop_codon:yes gene_type:complete